MEGYRITDNAATVENKMQNQIDTMADLFGSNFRSLVVVDDKVIIEFADGRRVRITVWEDDSDWEITPPYEFEDAADMDDFTELVNDAIEGVSIENVPILNHQQGGASVATLRTLCNMNGLSCKDKSGKYLSKAQMLKLLRRGDLQSP